MKRSDVRQQSRLYTHRRSVTFCWAGEPCMKRAPPYPSQSQLSNQPRQTRAVQNRFSVTNRVQIPDVGALNPSAVSRYPTFQKM